MEKEHIELLKKVDRKLDTLYLAIQGDRTLGQIGIIDRMGDLAEKVEEHQQELRQIKEEKTRNRWIVAAIATGAGLGSEKIIDIVQKFLTLVT